MYENMSIAFDSTYCFEWHDKLRDTYCNSQSATHIRELHETLVEKMPYGSKLLRDIDNHDTVTDWDGRTENIAGNNGMEQIEVLNYLIDGIPMVYSGNGISVFQKENPPYSNNMYICSYRYCIGIYHRIKRGCLINQKL